MIVLAGLCVLIGLAAPMWPLVLQPAVAVVASEQSPLSLWERARVRAVAESAYIKPSPPAPLPRGEGRHRSANRPTADGRRHRIVHLCWD